MTIIEQVGNFLKDKQWHPRQELEAIHARFSASILDLRDGSHDGRYWDIKKRNGLGKGQWEYKFFGFNEKYKKKSPHCKDCGSYNIDVRDDRK